MHAVAPSPLPVTTPKPTVKPEAAPLLPPILSGPAVLLWAWVLPIAILGLLNLEAYWLVEGNMEAKQRSSAWIFGGINLLNLLTGLALYRFARRQAQSGKTIFLRTNWGGVPALAVQIVYLTCAMLMCSDLLPWNVQSWIYPGQRFISNQFSFAMLPLFLGVLQLASDPSGVKAGKAIAGGVALALGAPMLLYAVSNLGRSTGNLFGFVIVFMLVVAGVLLMAGLMRIMMTELRQAQRNGPWLERGAIAAFALALPVLGLLLNSAAKFPHDFQAWEVYALTYANAAILMLASFTHARWPRLSLGLLSATFPFSLYFFLVFLPFVPLAAPAMILLGAGFLLLTPTILLTLHLHLLYKAQRQLVGLGARTQAIALGVGCGLILPGFFVARAVSDREALHAALDYLHAPTIPEGDIVYRGNLTHLRGALANHRSYKTGTQLPLLSGFYSWVVFDNLVLSDDKLERLERIFLGETSDTPKTLYGRNGRPQRQVGRRGLRPIPQTVEVANMAVHVTSAGAGDTTVTMALTLRNTGSAPAEYFKALPLPAGVFVSGFRLHINGQPVPGRITDKKTAVWMYTTIRDRERRDPGLLIYTAPGELELRVFPVDPTTPSIVEIDFLVPTEQVQEALREPGRDPATIASRLGGLVATQRLDAANGTVIAGLGRRGLPEIERVPYLHLIVDRSSTNAFTGDFAEAVKALRQRYPDAKLGRVSLANHNIVSLVSPLTPLDELAGRMKTLQESMAPSGGLALDLALAHGLRQHVDLELDAKTPARGEVPPQPIFVVLGSMAVPRTLELTLASAWSDVVPALEVHGLGQDGTFTTYRAATTTRTPLLRVGDSRRPALWNRAVRFAPAAADERLEYWSPKEAAWFPVASITTRAATGAWARAVSLHLLADEAARSPGDSQLDRRGLLAASRDTGVLIPSTSYIVVENSAQWKLLDLSERKKLGQSEALDLVETPAPTWVWLAAGFVLWLGARRWRQRRATAAWSG
ncbi:MAG: MSEP-CTERM sorting domain-containing protein [Verrucomicrobiota bacterium]